MAAMLQVIQVTLVSISLAFKGDVAISIAPHGQPHQPLDAIGKIKEDKQHLALLGGVDALMVHQFITQVNAGMHKKCSQQINRCESLERQYFCPEYLQRYKDSASRAENKKNYSFFIPRRRLPCPSAVQGKVMLFVLFHNPLWRFQPYVNSIMTHLRVIPGERRRG